MRASLRRKARKSRRHILNPKPRLSLLPQLNLQKVGHEEPKRRIMRALRKLSLVVPLLFGASLYAQNNTVVLKRAFVEKYKDRATIDVRFTVDHAHQKPNQPAKDGDMHVAGRAQKEVGLPMVAEVMNAAQKAETGAVREIHTVEGKDTALPI